MKKFEIVIKANISWSCEALRDDMLVLRTFIFDDESQERNTIVLNVPRPPRRWVTGRDIVWNNTLLLQNMLNQTLPFRPTNKYIKRSTHSLRKLKSVKGEFV